MADLANDSEWIDVTEISVHFLPNPSNDDKRTFGVQEIRQETPGRHMAMDVREEVSLESQEEDIDAPIVSINLVQGEELGPTTSAWTSSACLTMTLRRYALVRIQSQKSMLMAP